MPTVDFTKEELIKDLLPLLYKQTEQIVMTHFMSFIEDYFNPAVERLTNVETKVESIDKRITRVEAKLEKVETNLAKMDKRLTIVEKQTKDIKPTLRKHAADIDELQVAQGLR
jgi:septal ring factor EnvC (AmiA/AmiB activator)